MSTFLQLCQAVARESGTVSGAAALPTATTGQTGRLAKVVFWTAQAWREIQNRHATWLWMQDEFTGTLSSGAPRYTAASFSLTRWARWITTPDTLTMYLTATGVSDEGALIFMPWHDYRRTYERGTQVANRPVHFSVSPAGELCFGPRPDDTYTVRGEYRKSPQTLAADADEPEMPAHFHDLIAHRGLLLLAEHDEGVFHVGVANKRAGELFTALENEQLPDLVFGGPLA